MEKRSFDEMNKEIKELRERKNVIINLNMMDNDKDKREVINIYLKQSYDRVLKMINEKN